MTIKHSRLQSFILILGIIFIAFNLRPAITSVGPLIGDIRADLGISNGVAGMITTLPLLGFAVFSLTAPKIARNLGTERTIFFSLIVLLIGIFVRNTSSVAILFLGTALIGIGIAICNVLLPAIVKKYFPTKAGIMTSVYSTSMGLCAAVASGISIPIATGLGVGWKQALLVWGIIAFLGIVIWLPQIINHNNGSVDRKTNKPSAKLWTSTLAWQVTFFIGLQSILFYCSIAWMPQILMDRGLNISSAGWMLSIMQFASLPANFITPVLAGKLETQRPIVLVNGVLYVSSLLGILIGEGSVFLTVCIILLGIAQGSSISLALTFFSLRARNVSSAAQLSGMAQSVGYLLAAIGPLLLGILFDFTQSWTLPLITLLIVAGATTLAGIGAGRNEYVDTHNAAMKY
nr:MFS transporter [Paenibacillus bovis]